MILNKSSASYPCLERFSLESGVRAANLVAVLEIEREFHRNILATIELEARRLLYADVYARVHPLLRTSRPSTNKYRRLVRLLSRELTGKSVLDVGCGRGELLVSVQAMLPHLELLGLDISEEHLPNGNSLLNFRQCDIIDFRLDCSFDVVLSNQVLEHIAPVDLPTHLNAVWRALKPGGVFIALLPNALWGPHDVTRIVDDRRRGLTTAQGSHLNESTYSEMIPLLRSFGFSSIKTAIPLAMAMPVGKSVRVSPIFNLLLERNSHLRSLFNLIQRSNRTPLFQNPVILFAHKAA